MCWEVCFYFLVYIQFFTVPSYFYWYHDPVSSHGSMRFHCILSDLKREAVEADIEEVGYVTITGLLQWLTPPAPLCSISLWCISNCMLIVSWQRSARRTSRYLRECWGGGWRVALLSNQLPSTFCISEQHKEAHILLYNIKYLCDIPLPLLNKANKALFSIMIPHHHLTLLSSTELS